MNTQRRVELWPVERLRPRATNPRTHGPEQVAKLAASLAEFGFTQPILAEPDGGVVAGHGRLLAAKELGLSEVPVIPLDYLTPEQVRAYVIADNRLALDAGWDEELLAAELAALNDAGFDLALTGFTDDELAEMLGPLDEEQAVGIGEPDQVPELAPAPVSRRGDLWKLGAHRLLCGDATARGDVDRLLQGTRADMVWTDPPYNVGYEGKTADRLTIANDSMGADDFRAFLLRFFSAAREVTVPGGPIYVAHADTEGVNFRGAMVEAGWKLAQVLVWSKDAFVLGRQDYHWRHEPILYGWNPGGAHAWFGGRAQDTV